MRERTITANDTSRAPSLALSLCLLIAVGVVPLLLDPSNLGNTYYAAKARALYLLTPVILLAFGAHARTNRNADTLPLVAVGAFILTSAAATVLSVDPSWSLRGSPWRSEGFGAYLGYAAVFLSSLAVGRSGYAARWQVAVIACGAVVALYGIAQYLGYEWLVRDSQRLDWFQAFSTSGNANFLGAYMVLIFPLAVAAALMARQSTAAGLWICAAGTLFLAALCTYSRAAWAALAAEILLLGLWLPRLRPGVPRGRIIALTLALAFVTIVFVVPGGPLAPRAKDVTLTSRIRSGMEYQGPAVQSRLYLLKETASLLIRRPLLGYGPEAFPLIFPQEWDQERQRLFGDFPVTIDKAHNDTLDLAMSIGLLGVLAFWGVFGVSLHRALGIARALGPQSLLGAALATGLLSYWFDLQFQFSAVSVAPVFWSALGIAAGLPAAWRDSHVT